MGTTVVNLPDNIKEYFDTQLNFSNDAFCYRTVKSELRPKQYNALVEKKSFETGEYTYFMAITTFQKSKGKLYYKDMEEDMWPCYYDVSKGLIKLVEECIPNPSEYAKGFRENVHKFIEKKSSDALARKSFSWCNYPIGTNIKATNGKQFKIVSEPFLAYIMNRKLPSEVVRLDNGNVLNRNTLLKHFVKV